MSAIELQVGLSRWAFQIADGCLVTPVPRMPAGSAVGDVRAAVRDALDHPLRLDFPLRRAMTPDDRIALVIDEQLPRVGELVTGALEYLASAGIGPQSVTLLTAPGPTASQEWIDDLPDEFADVHTEVHQPADRKLLSYLATSKQGRRIYLNRTLIDADQIVSISGRRCDPQLGYAGCEGILYPALSDTETRRALGDKLSLAVPVEEPHGARAEAAEIAWLLGSPIYIQVIEGAGDEIAIVRAGLIDSSGAGIRLHDDRWRFSITEPVDVVLAAIAGDPARLDFSAFARAAACAARAVKDNGAIVILSEGEPAFGEGVAMLRGCDSPEVASKMLHELKPADRADAFQWLTTATKARIYLASGLNPEIVEEIFATPILSPAEAQRLVDSSGTCLVLPDANKSLVVIETG